MKVRISFHGDIVLEGETMQEIKERRKSLPPYSDEAYHKGIEFVGVDAVVDGDTNHDLTKEWNAVYNKCSKLK